MNDTQMLERLAARLGPRDSSEPLYRQLADAMAQAVEAGELPRGGTLPGERRLSEDLALSRVTVRKAIEELIGRGLLARRQGARTVVAQRVEKSLSRLVGFSEEIRARGMKPGMRWLDRQEGHATPTEVMALSLDARDEVIRLRRLRLADDDPIAIEHAVIPRSLLPSAEFEGESLYAALEARGVRPHLGTQRIRAGIMSEAEAKLLNSRAGGPLLIVERRCRLADGRGVEFTETRYNGEMYDFVTELQS